MLTSLPASIAVSAKTKIRPIPPIPLLLGTLLEIEYDLHLVDQAKSVSGTEQHREIEIE